MAESLVRERFLWFYHVAHPSTEDDMDDIVAAVARVQDHAPAIRARAREIRAAGDIAPRQGRL